MTKAEFLSSLRGEMSTLAIPKDEVDRSILFYSEMIDDKTDEGLSESEATESLGSPGQIAREIRRGLGIGGCFRDKLSALPKGLLIFGFPLWFPLLAAAAIVVMAMFLILWAMMLLPAAVEFALVAATAAGIIGGVWAISAGSLLSGLFTVGVAFIAGGMFFILLAPVMKLAGWLARTSLVLLKWTLNLFAKEEDDS